MQGKRNALSRLFHIGRARRLLGNPPAEMSVTLSVLPTRTAVIVLDGATDSGSAALAALVDQAVTDAFSFNAVDRVEVRRRNGDLLETRRRGGVLTA